MERIKQEYWDIFSRIAAQKLPGCGFTFELMPEEPKSPSSFAVKLSKQGNDYILSFSTHHLDFSDGVTVCTTTDGKMHYETVVLPPYKVRSNEDERYGYNEQEIARIVDDICLLPSPKPQLSRAYRSEKQPYLNSLYQAISQTDALVKRFPELGIYQSVLGQLLYIQEILVNENRMPTADEMDELTLGTIAVKNFDDVSDGQDPYGRLLINVYGNLSRYAEEDNRQVEVLEAAANHLQRLNRKYIALDEAYLKEEDLTKDGKTTRSTVWVVPYTYMVFEEEMAFIYLEKYTLGLIHILTKHGYAP